MEPNFHGIGGGFKQAGSFLSAQSFDVAKQQNGTKTFWELVDVPPDGIPGFVASQRLIGALGPRRETFGVVAIGQKTWQQGLDRLFGPAPPRAQLHQRGVDHNAMQPRRHLRVAREPADASKSREKSVLNDIAGIFLVADDAAGDQEKSG
jgi:hypothetical protein